MVLFICLERALQRFVQCRDISQLDSVRDDGCVGDRSANKAAGDEPSVPCSGLSRGTNILCFGRGSAPLFDAFELAQGIGDRIGPDYRGIAILFLLEKAPRRQNVKERRGFP